MEHVATPTQKHSISYQIFILVLTVLSLVIMVWMRLPGTTEETFELLRWYDNLICVIFLFDFYSNLRKAEKKSDYLVKERGWVDLLGSIPTFGIFQFTGLLRLFRLSRLARIMRLLQGKNRDAMVKDIITNRSSYTIFITALLTILVLCIGGALVLQFEGQSPDANIHTGWDAFWYSIVTITTVGYGDRYPVTYLGRITAMFIMFMGVGIIGVLASILSSVLVGAPPATEEETPPEAAAAEATAPGVEAELAAIKNELAALRQLLESRQEKGDQP